MKSTKLLAFFVALTLLFAVGCSSMEDVVGQATGSTPSVEIPGDFDVRSIPEFSGKGYVVINNNVPYFTEEDYTTESYETYGNLDSLGRCTSCIACIGKDLMPTEERSQISSVKPTAWHYDKYDFIDGELLYNRCHLIAYQLTAENVNEENLITGTHYLNETMQKFEHLAGDYVRETGNHVLYRVTPIFVGDDLLCRGLLMEGYSVEDKGHAVQFNVFCYNVQPKVSIDYASGDNVKAGESLEDKANEENTYILNVKSKKFHRPDCEGVEDIYKGNRQTYTGTRAKLVKDGYIPCGICQP